MPVTQEDLDKKAEQIRTAKEELVRLKSDRESREAQEGNELLAAQLDEELKRVRAEIDAEKNLRSGATNGDSLEESKAVMEAALTKAPVPAPEKKG